MSTTLQERGATSAGTIGRLVVFTLLFHPPAAARVSRLVVESRPAPAYRGQSFGTIGPYTRLTGRFYGELDPEDARNKAINDIRLAPRNARGKVEYSATFTLILPADLTKFSGSCCMKCPTGATHR